MNDDHVAPAVAPRGIYLNNAANALMSAPVLSTVMAHLQREAEVGGGEAAAEAEARLAGVLASAARLLNAHDDEIALAESGNRALQALLASVPLAAGDRVLVSGSEWGGSLAMLTSRPLVGIDVMAQDEHGVVDIDATRRRLHPRTRLVLASWCPATSGLIQPAAAIGALAAEIGAPYIVDACQAIGQLAADVRALRCDGLVASGRKWLRGPKGTALLFASRAFMARTAPFMPDQTGAPWSAERGEWITRRDARRYMQAESYVAGRLGLGVAIDGALALGVDTLAHAIQQRAARLRDGLRSIDGVTVHDRGGPLSGIVTFSVDGAAPPQVRAALLARGVTVATVQAFYAPIEMQRRGLTEVLRASPHLFTTDADLDAAVVAVAEVASELRSSQPAS